LWPTGAARKILIALTTKFSTTASARIRRLRAVKLMLTALVTRSATPESVRLQRPARRTQTVLAMKSAVEGFVGQMMNGRTRLTAQTTRSAQTVVASLVQAPSVTPTAKKPRHVKMVSAWRSSSQTA
jgi:hypothetical protein